MTQHPSLKSGSEGKFRSVLKRFERLKELIETEKWTEAKDSIFHLPKVKRIKFKIKKVKAAEEEAVPVEGAAPAEGAAPGAEGAPAGGAAAKEGGAPAGEAAPSGGKKQEKKK
ncbi:MAG: small basic protein [Candidatus Omnitrophota bacterium]